MSSKIFAIISASVTIISVANACGVNNWRHFPMEEILYKADIVVYGVETKVLRPNNPDGGFHNASFEVFCVFKNPGQDSILANITIEEVYPQTSCSGTEMKVGVPIILALQRTKSGNFKWHEVNVTPDGADFIVTDDVLARTARVCGLENPVPPEGRDASQEPSCPPKNTELCVIGAFPPTEPPSSSSHVVQPTKFTCVLIGLGLIRRLLFL